MFACYVQLETKRWNIIDWFGKNCRIGVIAVQRCIIFAVIVVYARDESSREKSRSRKDVCHGSDAHGEEMGGFSREE